MSRPAAGNQLSGSLHSALSCPVHRWLAACNDCPGHGIAPARRKTSRTDFAGTPADPKRLSGWRTDSVVVMEFWFVPCSQSHRTSRKKRVGKAGSFVRESVQDGPLVVMPFEMTCHTAGGEMFVLRSRRKPGAFVAQEMR